jgi:hypothetical protein
MLIKTVGLASIFNNKYMFPVYTHFFILKLRLYNCRQTPPFQHNKTASYIPETVMSSAVAPHKLESWIQQGLGVDEA